MTTANQQGIATFQATATAIAQGVRVAIDSAGKVSAASDSVAGIGVTEHAVAASGYVAVKLWNANGTFMILASGSITTGDTVGAAASGAVLTDGATSIGQALSDAVDGSLVEVAASVGGGGGGSVQVLTGAADPPTTPPDDPTSGAVYYTTGTPRRQYNWNPTTEEWDFFADAGDEGRLGTLVMWTEKAAGQLGADWTAPNWTVGATGAVCAPTLSAELIQDPETRNPTTGIGNWVAQGSNSVTADAGELVVTYVNNSAGAILTLSDAGGLTQNLAYPRLYRLTLDYRRTAGSTSDAAPFVNNGAEHAAIRPIPQSSVLTGRILDWHKVVETNLLYIPAGMTAGTTIRAGNFSIKEIDIASCLAIHNTAAPTEYGSITCKAVLNAGPGQGGMVGLVARANSASAPTSYLYARVTHDVTGASKTDLFKCISGTHTRVSSQTLNVYPLDGAEMEIQCGAGGLVRLFIDNVQVGADYTVTDASLGDYYGMFSTGADTSITQWWLGPTPSQSLMAWFGGSIVTYAYTIYGAGSHVYYHARNLRHRNPDRNLALMIGAENGYMAQNHLATLLSGMLTGRNPAIIAVCISGNHAGTDEVFGPILEGFIRRIRKDFPSATCMNTVMPYWDNTSVPTPHLVGTMFSDVGIAWTTALVTNYGFISLRTDELMLAEIAASPLGEAILVPWYNPNGLDGAHPTTAGIAHYVEIMDGMFNRSQIDGGASPYSGNIADYPRLYAGSDYWENVVENVATKDTWTETGTWANLGASDLENGYHPLGAAFITGRTSSTAGSKIAVTLTGRWPYCRTRKNVAGVARWRVNEGAWTTFNTGASAQSTWFWGNTAPMFETATEALLEIEVVSGTVAIAHIGML